MDGIALESERLLGAGINRFRATRVLGKHVGCQIIWRSIARRFLAVGPVRCHHEG